MKKTKAQTGEQQDISRVPPQLQPHVFKKGVSGNPMGRPPGPSLKERAKRYLAGLTDEEAIEFFEGMNKKDVWEMAEGKADTKTDITTKGEAITSVDDAVLDRLIQAREQRRKQSTV